MYRFFDWKRLLIPVSTQYCRIQVTNDSWRGMLRVRLFGFTVAEIQQNKPWVA